jgi:hypothetical protein
MGQSVVAEFTIVSLSLAEKPGKPTEPNMSCAGKAYGDYLS